MVFHQFSWFTIDGDVEVEASGCDGFRFAPDSDNAPRVIGVTGNVQDGQELAFHNLSGAPVTLVHRSGNASGPPNKLVLTGLGGDFAMPAGQILWGIVVDPNDQVLADADRGVYVDDGGQEPFVRAKTAATTSGPTNSGALAVVPEMTLTVAMTGGAVLVSFSCCFDVHGGDSGTVQLYVDSVPVADSLRAIQYTSSQGALDPNPSVGVTVSFAQLVTGLSAGDHTFETEWTRSTGTLRANGLQRSMYVIEIPAQ